MSSIGLPADNPTESFWTVQQHHLDNFRSSESLPAECDVLIVGSGFSGVGVAYHVLNDRHGSRSTHMPKTVMLEARKLVSGATGRNGGHVKPDALMDVTKKAGVYGIQQAAFLHKYEAKQVHLIKQLVDREGLDCDFQITRACDTIIDPAVAQQKIRDYHELVQDGVVDMSDIGYVSKKDAERISGVKGAQCCFTFTAGHLWPRKMMLQLLEKLIQQKQGLQVHANTAVLGISKTRDETGNWTITTARGTIKTKKLVICTNGYTPSLLPQYRNRIIPVRGVCSRLTSSKGASTPHLPSTYSLRFDSVQYDYMVPRTDGSIVVGGARQAFWHDRDSWWHNQNDHDQVRGTAEYFTNYMQRYFHGWEDSGMKVDSIWTGSKSCSLICPTLTAV